MIEEFPDFSSYENEYDNILDVEEKAKVSEALRDYFSAMKDLMYKDNLFEKIDDKQKEEKICDLEDYIFKRLYRKLFPSLLSEQDLFISQKCEQLSNLKPEQLIQDTRIIKKGFLKEASSYFSQINMGISPKEKIEYIIKGLKVIYNLITLTTGKEIKDQGADDLCDPFYYSLIISKIKNLASNVQYINMFIDKNLVNAYYFRISNDLADFLTVINESTIYE